MRDVLGSSSGPSVASRQLARPPTTCAHGCSATSSWRHPPTSGGTGCAGGYWAARMSSRSRAWRRNISSPLSRRVRRPRHIDRIVGSEKFVSQKLKLSQDRRHPRVADSREERSVARPSRRPPVIVARAAPPFPPIRRRGCSCASLLHRIPIHRDEPRACGLETRRCSATHTDA
jgi:hypothetical protein